MAVTYISGNKTVDSLPEGNNVKVSGSGTSGSGTTSRNVYMKDGITYLENATSEEPPTYDYGGGYVAPTQKDWSSEISSANEAAGDTSGVGVNPNASETTKNAVANAKEAIGDASIGKIDNIDTEYQKSLINQLTESQRQQAINSIDYGTNSSITELQRTEQDAQDDYKTQLNQIDADERRALDNQVLYNRARGDNGGIGASQYNSVQNAAAVNRLTVKNAQTKLSTDTSRQIADLRAQGEYEKADKLLEITQNYLSQLLDLEEYEQTTNLGIDEFNLQVDQWLNEYKLNVQQFLQDTELNYANVTGAMADGTLTQSAYANQQSQLAAIAQALISAGVAPTTAQLQALGLSDSQGAAWLSKLYPYG